MCKKRTMMALESHSNSNNSNQQRYQGRRYHYQQLPQQQQQQHTPAYHAALSARSSNSSSASTSTSGSHGGIMQQQQQQQQRPAVPNSLPLRPDQQQHHPPPSFTLSSAASSPLTETETTEAQDRHEDLTTPEGKCASLQSRLKRATRLLREIQELTPACEEVQHREAKEKQVFIRRILQASTELQDARDALQDLCRPPVLTARQFELVFDSCNGNSNNDEEEDGEEEGHRDDPYLDPSVRFFGLDWQQLFSRCLSLSLNLRVLGQQVCEQGLEVDLVLLSQVRRDLRRVEVDVASHGEAVLHGRLSKSQQRLIQQEQFRVTALTPSQPPKTPSSSRSKIAKSRSFRDSSRGRQAGARYRKTRTTDLNKLSARLNGEQHPSGRSQEEIRGEWREVMERARREEEEKEEKDGEEDEDEGLGLGAEAASGISPSASRKASSRSSSSRKSSFIQNVSSLFKHIR